MVVTEEITVRALGREIRRGIYRDFPTSFPRQIGLGRIEAPFSVHSVTRDGAAEPYSLQSTGGPAGRGGMRIPHWRRRRRSQSGYLPLHHRIRDPAPGLELRWAEAFSNALQPLMEPGPMRETMPWYHHDEVGFDPASFVSSLGTGLSSTLSASSSPPGSSGGGGGGSSGGGGGGGGGGGW